jgi:hypothetical protein
VKSERSKLYNSEQRRAKARPLVYIAPWPKITIEQLRNVKAINDKAGSEGKSCVQCGRQVSRFAKRFCRECYQNSHYQQKLDNSTITCYWCLQTYRVSDKKCPDCGREYDEQKQKEFAARQAKCYRQYCIGDCKGLSFSKTERENLKNYRLKKTHEEKVLEEYGY